MAAFGTAVIVAWRIGTPRISLSKLCIYDLFVLRQFLILEGFKSTEFYNFILTDLGEAKLFLGRYTFERTY